MRKMISCIYLAALLGPGAILPAFPGPAGADDHQNTPAPMSIPYTGVYIELPDVQPDLRDEILGYVFDRLPPYTYISGYKGDAALHIRVRQRRLDFDTVQYDAEQRNKKIKSGRRKNGGCTEGARGLYTRIKTRAVATFEYGLVIEGADGYSRRTIINDNASIDYYIGKNYRIQGRCQRTVFPNSTIEKYFRQDTKSYRITKQEQALSKANKTIALKLSAEIDRFFN